MVDKSLTKFNCMYIVNHAALFFLWSIFRYNQPLETSSLAEMVCDFVLSFKSCFYYVISFAHPHHKTTTDIIFVTLFLVEIFNFIGYANNTVL